MELWVIIIACCLYFFIKESAAFLEWRRNFRQAHGYEVIKKNGFSKRPKEEIMIRPDPGYVLCRIASPDGVLFCSKEVGHSGWHSHHGPVAWYMGHWAEDDYYCKNNIPWT